MYKSQRASMTFSDRSPSDRGTTPCKRIPRRRTTMGPGIFLSLFFCHLLWLASGNPVELTEAPLPHEEPEDLSFLHAEYARVKSRLCNMKWTAQGFHCYRYFDTPRTFSEAEEECQSYGGSVHLASITSGADSLFLAGLAENAGDVWVGLRNVDGCNSWTWIDGTPYAPRPNTWDADQPDQCRDEPVCVQLSQASKHFKWNDVGCETKSGYICETLAGQ